ncbi:MAG: aminoacyl--tRNA ligase-related protein [Enterobacteriaceae bacterium]
MKYSNYFIPTIKKSELNSFPISYQLMIRSGMIRKISSDIYIWLPIGYKVLNKLNNLIRKEMNKLGLLEILMPIMQSSSLLKKSGRLKKYGKELLKLYNRKMKCFILTPTNEELISYLVYKEMNSKKEIPIGFYQIQNKFRDEIRSKFGVIRSKEFIMKDAYTFHEDIKSLKKMYNKIIVSYSHIFNKLNLKFNIKKAKTGIIGGKISHEFNVKTKNYFKKETKRNEAIEIAHTFQIGDEYSKKMFKKKIKKNIMGCYGIGVTRLIAAIIEQNYDDYGIIWPEIISPFKIIILPIIKKNNNKIKKISKKIYLFLIKKKIDVLIYDKIDRPGIMFANADLIGIPHQLIISNRTLLNKKIEYRNRKKKKKILINIKDIKKFFNI